VPKIFEFIPAFILSLWERYPRLGGGERVLRETYDFLNLTKLPLLS